MSKMRQVTNVRVIFVKQLPNKNAKSIFFLALKQLKVIYCKHLRKCNDALEVMSQECVGSKTRCLAKELRRWSNQKSFDLRISIYMKQKCMCVSRPSQHCMYNNMFPNYSTVDRTMKHYFVEYIPHTQLFVCTIYFLVIVCGFSLGYLK